MARTQTRRSVSVSGDAYARLRAFCDANGVSMSHFVEGKIDEVAPPSSAARAKSAPGARMVAAPRRQPGPAAIAARAVARAAEAIAARRAAAAGDVEEIKEVAPAAAPVEVEEAEGAEEIAAIGPPAAVVAADAPGPASAEPSPGAKGMAVGLIARTFRAPAKEISALLAALHREGTVVARQDGESGGVLWYPTGEWRSVDRMPPTMLDDLKTRLLFYLRSQIDSGREVRSYGASVVPRAPRGRSATPQPVPAAPLPARPRAVAPEPAPARYAGRNDGAVRPVVLPAAAAPPPSRLSIDRDDVIRPGQPPGRPVAF